MSCIKLILLMGNSNAKHYFSELHLKKMRLVLLCIVIILDHNMLTPRFGFCGVTVTTTFLDFVHFCVHLVIMGFKQIRAET